MTRISRPVVRYHGSKYRIAHWLISHFPPHDVFVDVFGGGGSVLMSKPRSHGEVYNDLDGLMHTLFKVLRDREQAAELTRLIELTPFGRSELETCFHHTDDCDVEQARRLIVRSFQGHGSDSAVRGHRTGFRSKRESTGQNGWPAREWARYPAVIADFTERLNGVTLENRSWEWLIPFYDGPNTLMYLDPPYLMETRSPGSKARRRGYRFEMADDDHERLLQMTIESESMFVVSGYESEIYNDLLIGWDKRYLDTHAEGSRPRTEVLWLCPRASAMQMQGQLFDG